MNISSGISEITFNSFTNNRIHTRKAYVWPIYGEGRVEKIKNVVRRTDSNHVYSKPVAGDIDRVLDRISRFQNEYNSGGEILKKNTHSEPGLLFDAFA